MLKYIKVGKWFISSGAYKGMYVVRVSVRPTAWEIQFAHGDCAVNDGFESLAHVRAWLALD